MNKGYCSKGQTCLANTDCIGGTCANGLCGKKLKIKYKHIKNS